jgi:hypothetical protein
VNRLHSGIIWVGSRGKHRYKFPTEGDRRGGYRIVTCHQNCKGLASNVQNAGAVAFQLPHSTKSRCRNMLMKAIKVGRTSDRLWLFFRWMDILAHQIDSGMVLGKIKEDGRRAVTSGTLWMAHARKNDRGPQSIVWWEPLKVNYTGASCSTHKWVIHGRQIWEKLYRKKKYGRSVSTLNNAFIPFFI